MNESEQLKAENSQLKLLLIKLSGVIKDQVPYPSDVELVDHCHPFGCFDCWKKAINTIGGENT